MEVLSLVRARVALSWKFLHRRELHVLVLGGRRQEGAGLLFGSGLASAARDVDEGIDGARQTNSWIAKPLPGEFLLQCGRRRGRRGRRARRTRKPQLDFPPHQSSTSSWP